MGFFIRKSLKLGPVRLNVSKSGIGASAGVKGLRVSSGPRGTQLNAGRKGLYYRKQLSSSQKPTQANTNSTAVVLAVVIIFLAAAFGIGLLFILGSLVK